MTSSVSLAQRHLDQGEFGVMMLSMTQHTRTCRLPSMQLRSDLSGSSHLLSSVTSCRRWFEKVTCPLTMIEPSSAMTDGTARTQRLRTQHLPHDAATPSHRHCAPRSAKIHNTSTADRPDCAPASAAALWQRSTSDQRGACCPAPEDRMNDM